MYPRRRRGGQGGRVAPKVAGGFGGAQAPQWEVSKRTLLFLRFPSRQLDSYFNFQKSLLSLLSFEITNEKLEASYTPLSNALQLLPQIANPVSAHRESVALNSVRSLDLHVYTWSRSLSYWTHLENHLSNLQALSIKYTNHTHWKLLIVVINIKSSRHRVHK